MAHDQSQPEKPWRELAEEVSRELDSDKIVELTEALIHALNDEVQQRADQITQIKTETPRRRQSA